MDGNSSMTSPPHTTVPEPYPRSAASSLPEVPQGQHPSIAASKDLLGDDDLVYNLVRREVHDYQSLDRGSGSRPIVEQPSRKPTIMSGPASSDPKPPAPSTSQTPMSAASSLPPPPDYRTIGLASDNTRPEPRAQIHQPSCSKLQAPVCAEEIVELQSKTNPADDKQSEAIEASSRQRAAEVTHIPSTNFAIACMVTLCFNLPLGILAMYFSLKAVRAFQDGHYKLGQKRSRWSIFASLLGIAFTTVLVSSIVLYIAMQGQRRISQYRAYSVKAGLSL